MAKKREQRRLDVRTSWTRRGRSGNCLTIGRNPTRFAMTRSAPLLSRIAAALTLALAFAAPASAQDKKASPPVLVTSLGQSLDAFQVQLAVRRAGIKYKYDPRAEIDQ